MKIYDPKPVPLVRIQIQRRGDKTQYLTLCDTDIFEVQEFCQKLVDDLKPEDLFEYDYKTGIYIREAVGSKNGRNVSVSLVGLSPEQVLFLILTKIKNHE